VIATFYGGGPIGLNGHEDGGAKASGYHRRGSAGLPLSHMLHRDGIDCILLEGQSRTHVMERIRAGVLAAGTVEQPEPKRR